MTRISRAKIGSFLGTLSEAELDAVDFALADFLELNGAKNDLEREMLRNEELKAKIADLEGKLAAAIAEVEKKELDAKVYELAYAKVLDRLVEKQIDLDYLKKLAQAPVPVPVEVVEEAPKPENPKPVEVVEEKVNINTCTEREVMNLGFTFSVARNIVSARPFLKMDDLRVVPGMTRIAFGLIEKKVTLGDVSEYQKPKKPVVKLDPLETVEPVEPVSDKVNINTASAAELAEKLGLSMTVCYSITGVRKREGLYKSVEDLLNVPRFQPSHYEKYKDKVCV